MEKTTYFMERAAQCRRLADGSYDERVIRELEALAEEYEAKARDAKTRNEARKDAHSYARRHPH